MLIPGHPRRSIVDATVTLSRQQPKGVVAQVLFLYDSRNGTKGKNYYVIG